MYSRPAREGSDASHSGRSSAGYQLVRKQYFQLMPYQVLLLIVNTVNGIVDSIFASNMIGKTCMTAIGLFGPFNHFLYAISIMLVSSSQILCGRHIGQNQRHELQNVFSLDIVFSLLISTGTALLMIAGSLLNWTSVFTSNELERAALNEYFLGQAFGVPGLILGQQLFSFLSMEGRTKRTMAATLCCVTSNALMNVLFVSVIKMGTFGLALGSSVSAWVFFAVMAVCYLKGKSEVRFALKKLKWQEIKEVILLGYPSSLSRFTEMFRCIIVNSLILQYVGSNGLSSFAASNSVMSVFWTLPFGMMAVDRMLLSISIGEEDRKATVDIMRVICRWGILFISCVAVLVSLMAEPLTRLFFQDPADPVYGMTVMGLRILPFCMLFSVINHGFSCYFQIMEKRFFSTVLPVLNGAVFVILFSWLLIPSMQMNGLYLANIFNGACCLLTVVLFSVVQIRRLPRNLTDLLAFPDSFGVDENNFLEFSVSDKKDVSSVALRVEQFCLRKGIDKRRAVFSGLALEESAGNIMARGSQGTQPDRQLDIRVAVKDGSVILRLKDNCPPFTLSEQMEIANSQDGIKNVGLRILSESAAEFRYQVGIVLTHRVSREFHYQNVLGHNVLFIRI